MGSMLPYIALYSSTMDPMHIPPLFNQPVGFHRDPPCHGASRASRAMGRRSRGLFVAVVPRSKPWENHRKTIGK